MKGRTDKNKKRDKPETESEQRETIETRGKGRQRWNGQGRGVKRRGGDRVTRSCSLSDDVAEIT